MASSHSEVQKLFSGLTQSVDAIKAVQNAVFGEFRDLASLVYWLLVSGFCYLLGGFPRLRGGRVPTLAICALGFVLEQFVCLWWLRTAEIGVIIFIFARATYCFVDYSKESCHRLGKLEVRIDQTPLWFKKYREDDYARTSLKKPRQAHYDFLGSTDTSDRSLTRARRYRSLPMTA